MEKKASLMEAWTAVWTRPWQEMTEYMVDLTQRWLMYLDVKRKAANIMLDHHAAGMPPVLKFEHESILDARTFDRPANYELLYIMPPPGVELDATKPPLVIVDPRAGHGPGIGGFKGDSEVGMALREGFHTYFVSFFPEPCEGQTLEDIELAEIRFLEEVHRRHPDAGRPVVYGNCQAGWAVAMLGADRPDVCGPIIINGAPLSYWAGRAGATPMRAMGGVSGGDWGVRLACDLGRGRFDGAWLVQNFENLNPANTLFKKNYDLLRSVDTQEERFLDFERWWTGFYQLTEDEINWITDSLFIGNDLEQGTLKLSENHHIDMRRAQDPIVVFASRGDNITPPAQALGWIHEIYPTTEELKRHGQRVIYMLHSHAGHLGIFVSAKVARREHRAIIENLERFPDLEPGLYEMVIEGETGEADPRKPQFVVSFNERRVEDICYNRDQDEHAFERAERLAARLDSAYRMFFRPLIRPMIVPPVAEAIRWMHPARSRRVVYSERLNPLMHGVAALASLARSRRKKAKEDNPYLQLERIAADGIVDILDAYRDARDGAVEAVYRAAFS
jgi:hypothetical protein